MNHFWETISKCRTSPHPVPPFLSFSEPHEEQMKSVKKENFDMLLVCLMKTRSIWIQCFRGYLLLRGREYFLKKMDNNRLEKLKKKLQILQFWWIKYKTNYSYEQLIYWVFFTEWVPISHQLTHPFFALILDCPNGLWYVSRGARLCLNYISTDCETLFLSFYLVSKES